MITDDHVKDFGQPWKNPFYNVQKLLQRTIDQYQNRIDGVIGTGDLYGSVFAAYISEKMNLPGSKTRSVLIFNHEYYSREYQQAMVEAEHLPTYGVINSLSISKPSQVEYPCFVKPIKGTMSMRAQTVYNDHQLKRV